MSQKSLYDELGVTLLSEHDCLMTDLSQDDDPERDGAEPGVEDLPGYIKFDCCLPEPEKTAGDKVQADQFEGWLKANGCFTYHRGYPDESPADRATDRRFFVCADCVRKLIDLFVEHGVDPEEIQP